MIKQFILSSLMIFAALPALSHPPGSIQMSFEPQSSIAVIEVEHRVGSDSGHFIKEIEVSLNGEEVIRQSFSSQSFPSYQKAVYYLHDASEGDKVEVYASCSRSGSLDGSFEITRIEEEEPEEE